jgi:hypothetical protein
VPTPEECSEQIEPDCSLEFLDRRLDHRTVCWRRSTRIVVQNMQTAIVLHSSLDRGPDAIFLAHVGRDRNALSAGLGDDLRGLFPAAVLISATTTFAPFAAMARAVARPIPVPAPVIRATFPSRRAIPVSPRVVASTIIRPSTSDTSDGAIPSLP